MIEFSTKRYFILFLLLVVLFAAARFLLFPQKAQSVSLRGIGTSEIGSVSINLISDYASLLTNSKLTATISLSPTVPLGVDLFNLPLSGSVQDNSCGEVTLELRSNRNVWLAKPVTLVVAGFNLRHGRFGGRIQIGKSWYPLSGTIDVSGFSKPTQGFQGPCLTSVTPTNPRPGDTVTLSGRGFSDPATGFVFFEGPQHTDFPTILNWTDTSIQVRLGKYIQGAGNIRVSVAGKHTNVIFLEVSPTCPPVEPFVRRISLGTSLGLPADTALAVWLTPDCDILVAGSVSREVGATSSTAFLLKLNGAGIIQPGWPIFYAQSGSISSDFVDVIVLPNGDYLAVGTTDIGVLGAPNNDIFMVRTDPDGVILPDWPKTFGDSGNQTALDLTPALDLGYAVVGWTIPPDASVRSALFLSFSGDGVPRNDITTIPDFNEARAVEETLPGTFSVTTVKFVASSPTVGIGGIPEPSPLDGFASAVVQVGALGNVQSSASVDIDGSDQIHAAISTSDLSQVIAVGEVRGAGFSLSDSGVEALTFGLSQVGWTKDFANAITGLERAFTIREATPGLYYVAGNAESDGSDSGIDGLVALIDCGGIPIAPPKRISQGGAETINDLRVVRSSDPESNDIGIVAVGTAIYANGVDSDIFLVRDNAFPSTSPEIDSFLVDGTTTVTKTSGTSVTLNWEVSGATNINLRRVVGPGPNIQLSNLSPVGSFTFTFTVNETACSVANNTCTGSEYELTARVAGSTCDGSGIVSKMVTIMPPLSTLGLQLALIEANMISRFGTRSSFSGVPSHVAVTPPPASWTFPVNRCFTNQGLPYLRPQTIINAQLGNRTEMIDVMEPGLLYYDTNDLLIGWAYASFFSGPPPRGLRVRPNQWFGHWGGWHLGNGGMRASTTEAIPSPICTSCRPFGAEPPPYVPHPILWDLHVFRNPAGGVPEVGRFTSDVGFPDPCSPVSGPLSPVSDCSSQGIELFPNVNFPLPGTIAVPTLMVTACP